MNKKSCNIKNNWKRKINKSKNTFKVIHQNIIKNISTYIDRVMKVDQYIMLENQQKYNIDL